jgi:hypothetical protein
VTAPRGRDLERHAQVIGARYWAAVNGRTSLQWVGGVRRERVDRSARWRSAGWWALGVVVVVLMSAKIGGW